MFTHPKLLPLGDATGIDVIDPIETRHFSLFTDRPVSPTETDPEEFPFPVLTAARVRCGGLTLPYVVPIEIRMPGGNHWRAIDPPTVEEFARGEYLLELHSPIKIYLRFTAETTIEADSDGVTISFAKETDVEVGARSYHSEPASTITVPDDPEAMMTAVSAFSSALKTTSPERSWPTMRGHPPRIERGDELVLPDLDVPDTGITVTVPPEYGHVYTVAPLAYYLGADVVPGESARLLADSGVARFLGDDVEAVGETVESLLKRVFLLDCVTRTEGLYPDDLHERDSLEAHADLDLAELYDASIADRLHAYLSVPDEALAAIESPWHQVTHVEADPGFDTAELLPYVVNDLSPIRVKSSPDGPWTPTETQQEMAEAIDAFVRSASAPASANGDFLRSARLQRTTRRQERVEDERGDDDSVRGVPGVGEYAPLPESDALSQAWVGDRTPTEGSKLLLEAFDHDQTASEDGTVEITVVCNDEEMRAELESAAEIYGTRDYLRTNVTCAFDVSTAELRDLLGDDSDVFHFIGHIDGVGFQCRDGVLDAETLDETGAKLVLLNGCRSHDQGVALVEAGARAAVVSLADLWNSGAVEVGETLARLLQHGFSVGHAMELVREHTSLGREYVVLGDPGVTLIMCENGLPTVFHVTDESDPSLDPDEVVVTPHAYPNRTHGVGSTFRPHLPDADSYHVGVGAGYETRVSVETLAESFGATLEPLIVDEELTWTDEWFDT